LVPQSLPFAIVRSALVAAGLALASAAAAQDAPVPVNVDTADQPALVPGTGFIDAPNPDLVLTLGAGVEVSPAYYGSDEYEGSPDALFRLDFVRLPGGLEFGSTRTVGFQQGFGLQGSARYVGARDSDDFDEIDGLDDIPWSLELGLGVGYEQRNYRLFADARYGVIGHHSWVGELGADGIVYPVDGLTLTLGPRVEFGTRSFMDTYFGVSPEEELDSGIDAYDPGGGVYSAGVEFGARYLLNERWGVEGAAEWGRLVNDASDSPITESEDRYQVRIGVTRRISLDF
jgi:outer membrane scaffolding protein for murein synthesis (MipA/OmpV family)